jgi:hypothetical protein
MSPSELELFNFLSFFQRSRYLLSAQQASEYAESFFPNRFDLWNGKGDAYRHAMWNALGVKRLGEELMEQLATLHEDQEPWYDFEYKEVEMDLFNNQVGRSIGLNMAENEITWLLVQQALEAGELRYLNPRGSIINGHFDDAAANANSNLIPTNQ